MATNPKCDVQVGSHPGPYWFDANTERPLRVCDRHRSQYEERSEEFGPFDWQPQGD